MDKSKNKARSVDEKNKEQSQGQDGQQVRAWIKKYVGLRTFGILCIVCGVGIVLVWFSFSQLTPLSPWQFICQEIGKGLLVTVLLSFGVNALIRRSTRELHEYQARLSKDTEEKRHGQVIEELNNLKDDISIQTKRLVASVSSLQALYEADVACVYKNRSVAAKNIEEALKAERTGSIRIMGISLNDFLRDEDKTLSAAWHSIECLVRPMPSYAASKPGPTGTLDIKVLLIDPQCSGAFLRAGAECTQDKNPARLVRDVEGAIARLKALLAEKAKVVGNDNLSVSIAARLYRTPPLFYLVTTSQVSFLQLYYFRPSHRSNVNIPVLEFVPHRKDDTQTKSIHEELGFHFDWIWAHASIDLLDYADRYCHGTDTAIRQAHISNIYTDRTTSRQRIRHLIEKHGNTRIWIKGISLQSYFESDSDLYTALCDACKKPGIDIRILLIDPTCEQARIRAFREYLIDNDRETFDEFCKGKKYISQRLVIDTQRSIEAVNGLIRDTRARKKSGNDTARFQAKLFESAPESFMLLTDTAVIVEQYHYGQSESVNENPTGDIGRKTILNKVVPLIEYANTGPSREYQEIEWTPYHVFEDHFRFVFEQCSKNISECKPKHANNGAEVIRKKVPRATD